jgi:hypothetical protein
MGPGSTSVVYPEWWGAGPLVADNTPFINAACAAAPAGATVLLTQLFPCTGTVNVKNNASQVIRGFGGQPGLDLGSTGELNAAANGATVRDLYLSGTTTPYLLNALGAANLALTGITCSGGNRQIYLNSCSDFTVSNTHHSASLLAGSATTIEGITVYACNHGIINEIRCPGYTAPVTAGDFNFVNIQNSDSVIVDDVVAQKIDLSQCTNGGVVSVFGSTNCIVNGVRGDHCWNADGVAVQNNGATRSTDALVSDCHFSYLNATVGAGANTNSGTGFDIFSADRVSLSNCSSRLSWQNGAGALGYLMEINSCTEVTAEQVNCSDNATFHGIGIIDSPDTKLTACTSRRNWQSGCYVHGTVTPSTNVWLIGCEMSDNNVGAYTQAGNPTNVNGLYVADASTVRTVGGRYTDSRSGGSKTQLYGIQAQNTSNVQVTGRADLTGNKTASILDGASLISVLDALWDQTGIAAVTPGASPATVTVGSGRERHYAYGGTVSSVTLNGTQIAASSPFEVQCEPHDSVVLTYSVVPTSYVRRII